MQKTLVGFICILLAVCFVMVGIEKDVIVRQEVKYTDDIKIIYFCVDDVEKNILERDKNSVKKLYSAFYKRYYYRSHEIYDEEIEKLKGLFNFTTIELNTIENHAKECACSDTVGHKFCDGVRFKEFWDGLTNAYGG